MPKTSQTLDHWAAVGRRLDWIKPFSDAAIQDVSFAANDLRIRWFYDGTLNVAANCIDRHLPARADQTAIIWVPDGTEAPQVITYQDLSDQVGRWANMLLACGVTRGDAVVIYLPMIPAAAYAMLACARIGAVHSVVFAGFSARALSDRIQDCQAKLVITADQGLRGGKTLSLKHIVDEALAALPALTPRLLVVRHDSAEVANQEIAWHAERDRWVEPLLAQASPTCPAAEMAAEDPLFILYTSGSTGKPKGIVHTTGGYLAYAAHTHAEVFDLREGDIFWCTADVGWITGHSYLVYGPLANGTTTVMFEGVPTYPNAGRWWQEIERLGVTIFYTAPTAIRSLMRLGDDWVRAHNLSSLRVLGSVGEPLNTEAWRWYHEVVGGERCAVVDTWWQTETGGILLAPTAATPFLKGGSVQRPRPLIQAALFTPQGQLIPEQAGVEAEGNLCLASSWPGQARGLYGDQARFIDTYFRAFPGYYFSGDGARRDGDGDYWITGRVDDVINVSGHRIGTAEIESALDNHHAVAETAVVGYPHDVKGQGIYAFVTLKQHMEPTPLLQAQLRQSVRDAIGPIATPDVVQWASALPKTRSGKIMRRILRKIAEGALDQLGDTSTLADPSVVDELIANRPKLHEAS
jgi:acetyl-CoA synthetase